MAATDAETSEKAAGSEEARSTTRETHKQTAKPDTLEETSQTVASERPRTPSRSATDSIDQNRVSKADENSVQLHASPASMTSSGLLSSIELTPTSASQRKSREIKSPTTSASNRTEGGTTSQMASSSSRQSLMAPPRSSHRRSPSPSIDLTHSPTGSSSACSLSAFDHLSNLRAAPKSPSGSPQNSAFVPHTSFGGSSPGFAMQGSPRSRRSSQHRRPPSISASGLSGRRESMSRSPQATPGSSRMRSLSSTSSGSLKPKPASDTDLNQVRRDGTQTMPLKKSSSTENATSQAGPRAEEEQEANAANGSSIAALTEAESAASTMVPQPKPSGDRHRNALVIRDFAFPPSDERYHGRGRIVSRVPSSETVEKGGLLRGMFGGGGGVVGGAGGFGNSGGFLGDTSGGKRKSSFGSWGGFSLGGFGWGNLRGKQRDTPEIDTSAASSPDVIVPSMSDLTPSSSVEPRSYLSPTIKAVRGQRSPRNLSDDEDDAALDDGDDDEGDGGSSQIIEGVHRVLYSFVAEGAHEMSVEEGDFVMVKGRLGDGWVIAQRLEEDSSSDRSGHSAGLKEGLVPESYLGPVSDSEEAFSDEPQEDEGEFAQSEHHPGK